MNLSDKLNAALKVLALAHPEGGAITLLAAAFVFQSYHIVLVVKKMMQKRRVRFWITFILFLSNYDLRAFSIALKPSIDHFKEQSNGIQKWFY